MRVWFAPRHAAQLNHEIIWGPIVAVALAAAFVLPHLPHFDYPCAFLKLTGHPCVSCGMTRSWTAAASGHFPRAWLYNPVGLLLFFAALLYVPYACTVLVFRLPRLHLSLTRRWEHVALRVLVVLVLLANWTYLWIALWPPIH